MYTKNKRVKITTVVSDELNQNLVFLSKKYYITKSAIIRIILENCLCAENVIAIPNNLFINLTKKAKKTKLLEEKSKENEAVKTEEPTVKRTTKVKLVEGK